MSLSLELGCLSDCRNRDQHQFKEREAIPSDRVSLLAEASSVSMKLLGSNATFCSGRTPHVSRSSRSDGATPLLSEMEIEIERERDRDMQCDAARTDVLSNVAVGDIV